MSAASALVIALISLVLLVVAAGLWVREHTRTVALQSTLAAAERARGAEGAKIQDLESRLAATQPRLEAAAADAALVAAQTTRIKTLEGELDQLRGELQAAATQLAGLRQDNALLQNHVQTAEQREGEVRKLLQDAQTALRSEFEVVANTILETKAKSLTEENRKTLNGVLDPFNKHLEAFKAAVEETHKTDIRERSSLKTEITQLTSLNKTLGAQAQSLTDALRGQAKVRGNWGEAILSRVLEESGLREGHEFTLQPSFTTDDSRRQQPDVVVNLPEGRFVIIDSKLSLIDYERYASAADDAARESALRAHVGAIQNHINELSRKDYPKLYGLKTLDFVLMFVPIEPALMLALQAAPELADNALAKHISLVSPNTLYTALRTIDYIWRVDRTSKNMQQIVKLGGQLYDSAVLFAESLQDVGDHIDRANAAFHQARQRLTGERTSVLRRAERLRALGVTTNKRLPASVQDALGDDVPPDQDAPQLGTPAGDAENPEGTGAGQA
ncbi:MAG: DNA recombination protein RmuC [Rhodanobacteraceae bacterium]|nr:MAG: DNA recombination protein RmuC [Rhodanobacteraceae bacterium]